jgi:hypothetical protein
VFGVWTQLALAGVSASLLDVRPQSCLVTSLSNSVCTLWKMTGTQHLQGTQYTATTINPDTCLF